MKYRLQKLLAQANLGSRRATEDFITAGRIKVNGEVAILGTKADPDVDIVTLDGERLNLKRPPVHVAYYKPVNVISSMERQPGDDRPTVREMVPLDGHLFSIGRLDVESEGLIILTNDGDLTNTLTHPRYEHTKTYQVTVYGVPDRGTLDRWENGVSLSEEDGTEIFTAPCYVEFLRRDGDTSILKVVMTEGRNRQIRRVAATLGHPVRALVRTHIGRFGLNKLKRGDYAEMSEQEVRLLSTPATELEDIKKIKAQRRNSDRRAHYMSLSTASPEQIEEAKRNRPAPAPRPGKKYTERRDFDRDDRGGDDRPRRSLAGGTRRSGPPDGKRGGYNKPFRSRLMIDETGGSASRHGRSETPEGFRSRLGEDDRRPRRREDSRDNSDGFRSRLSEVDRPARRPYNRDGNRSGGGDRPYRARPDGDRPSRPYNREGDDRPRRPRPDGERGGGDRPYRARPDGDRPSRPYNREGDDRPRGPRPDGERGGGDRPYRARPDGDRPSRPYNREGDDRPRRPRPDGERGGGDRPYRARPDGDRPSRPYNREGGDRPRGPRPDGQRGGDRPYRARPDGDRPSRPYNREGGDRPRGPRPDGERGGGDRPYRARPDGDRPSRPYNREGGDRPRRPRPDGERGGGDRPYRARPDGDRPSRPYNREGDDRPRRPRPDGERGGGDRPYRARPDGDRPSRPYNREGDDRPRRPRPDGERGGGGRPSRPFNREGGDRRSSGPRDNNRPYNNRPRRDGDSRPPRRDSGDRPARPPKKREDDE